MSLRIATNIQSMAAQRALSGNKENQGKTLERLSSGERINRSGDDAAGLAISEKMRAQLRSMKQAERNANDGISMIQVAEGGLNELGNILIRLRELSMQSASDTIGELERSFVDKEVQHLKTEMERITGTIEFNGLKLLDGTAPMLEIQVGIHNNPTGDRLVYDSKGQETTNAVLGLDSVNVLTKESSQENLAQIDNALNVVNRNRSDLGALQNRLGSTINNLVNYQENLAAAKSRIRDTDMAFETSQLVKQNILTTANIAVLSQANTNPQAALQLLQ